MSFTATDLLHCLNTSGSITRVYSGVRFNISPSINYGVERIAIRAHINDETPVINRIYVTDTQLRHIAMHIADCIDRLTQDCGDWPRILEDIYVILRKQRQEKP